MGVTRLAHQYDVEILLAECERSLKHAHEVPIIDRLLLAELLQLEGVLVSCMPQVNQLISRFQVHLTSLLSAKDWKELIVNESEKISMLSKEFLNRMTYRFIA